MPSIVLESKAPKLSDEWVDAPKFNSKGRKVDENGKEISKEYQGKVYEIITKKERKLTLEEQIKRKVIAVAVTIISLGLGLLFKQVRTLFTQNIEKIRIAKEVIKKISESE